MSVADVIQAIDGPLTVTACSDDRSQLRPVLEVQHPRSALADQGPDRLGAGGDVGGRAGAPTCRRCRRRRAGGVPMAVPVNVVRKHMITVTDNAADADPEAARQAARRGARPARRRQGRRLLGVRVRLRVGSRAARERPGVRRPAAACACGSIRAAIGCSTARRSTTTRACSAAASCSRTRTPRARAGAGRRFRCRPQAQALTRRLEAMPGQA